ncbi:MAG: flagellar basal body rod C-terminal domain-containing protein, partial [Opitutaceae bacterium]|jgi:flagellar hook-associated protein 1 FlgK
LLQKADILTDGLQLTDTRLTQVQSDMTTQVSTDTQSVNSMLQSIAALNLQISRFEVNSPGGAVDLRDSRQAKLEELAAKMNFEVRDQPGSAGQIEIYTKDGMGAEVLLVSRAASATLAASTDASGASLVTASNIPGAAVGATATLDIVSGSIKGAMDTFDTVQDMRDENDALAAQLVTSVNAAYNPSGTGTDFFVATGVTAKTIERTSTITAANLEPDLTSGGATGDTTIPNAVAAIASRIFSTSGSPADLIDGTLSQHFLKSVTNLGQTLSGINSRLTDQQSIEKLVRTQRDSISGVSLDEEMADLMKYQRAFQGSSRIIAILDELMKTVVNLGA